MYSLSVVFEKILRMRLTKEENFFLTQLGLKLRHIREEKGWTLEYTEEKGWPSWRHLQQIECGKNITLITLKRISNLYNIPLKNFF